MSAFRVYSVDWQETADDAHEVKAYDEADACDEWCRWADGNSNFVDGYPDKHRLRVIRPDGSTADFLASTDWSPDFYVRSLNEEDGK